MTSIRTTEWLGGQGLLVTLAVPKGNILDSDMTHEICAMLDDLQGNQRTKLLCFAGEGEHFSFGASVQEHQAEQAPAMLKAFHGIFLRLADLAIPTAAAVCGQCLGGGMELAAYCNRVVARPEAVFAQPEIKLGVLPPVAALILPSRVGQARADDLILTGRSVGAAAAKQSGIVDEIAENPLAAIEQWATRELLPKSASSLRWALRATRWQFHQTLRHGLEALERLYVEELMETADAHEGVAAFLEKRKPSWQYG